MTQRLQPVNPSLKALPTGINPCVASLECNHYLSKQLMNIVKEKR